MGSNQKKEKEGRNISSPKQKQRVEKNIIGEVELITAQLWSNDWGWGKKKHHERIIRFAHMWRLNYYEISIIIFQRSVNIYLLFLIIW